MTAINVHFTDPIGTVNPNIYGHFAEHLGGCIYGGIWVGKDSSIPNINGIRTDTIEALKRIAPPVVRWPGGCFADDYHWRDGIGTDRPKTLNIWWDDTESNELGTHEFMEFCHLIGSEPYFVGNVGSGTPSEMRNWVEYCNYSGDSTLANERRANGADEPFGVKYWGVGNENWGCGGNFEPDDYAMFYRQFSTYLRDFSGTELYLIACGPSSNDVDWTCRFFDKLGKYRRIHAYAAHYYCWTAGNATEYTVEQWYELLANAQKIEDLIKQQRATMDSYDPERKIGLIIDEWGTWHPPAEGHNPRHLWQQNTLRDALVAANSLDIFNRHADKVVMTNIAQTINVLQAMILTDEDKLITTPTYHVYDMYQSHQGGMSLNVTMESDTVSDYALAQLSGSASLKDNVLTLSIVNVDAEEAVEATINLFDTIGKSATITTLSNDDIHAHNTFDAPEAVKPTKSIMELDGKTLNYTFPAASVTVFKITL